MRVLLTVNGTPKSESVLSFAIELCRRWHAELLVARVLDPVVGMGDPIVPLVAESFYKEMVHAGEEYMERLKERISGVTLRTFCPVGEPGECIRELAVKEHCDLLIMASHGHTGFVRWMWGSVAEGMARSAPCPVLLVRRDTPVLFQQILVPVDGEAASWRALDQLALFYDPKFTRVTVLHCHPDEHNRTDLKSLVEGKPWLHLEFKSAPAPEGIFEWLADHPCDLVAMATHGREGLAHLWTGSIMEQVARNAHCPVLVFPPSA